MWQTLFALRTLRQNGMPNIAICALFQAKVVNKLLLVALARWSYASTADSGRLEASSVDLFRLDTVTRQLPHSSISMNELTRNCTSSTTTSIYSAHQKGVLKILLITAVTTCGFQFASQQHIDLNYIKLCTF